MKLIVSACLVCYGCISMAQSTSSEYKIESFYLLYGKEELYHGNQHFSNFSNTVDNSTFFPQNDSGNVLHSQNNNYLYSGYSGQVSLRNGDSKWRFVLGASWSQGTNRSYSMQETNDYIVDTLYAAVPAIVMATDNGFAYRISYDTLYLDSVARHEWSMESKTKNVFVSTQILRDFKKNKYTFSTGIGLAIGMSVKNEIFYAHNQYWGLQMVRNSDPDYVQAVWHADIPEYNPAVGTYTLSPLTQIDSDRSTGKGNMLFTFKPFIPLRIEAHIAEQGFFSKVGVVGSLNVGGELQLIKNDTPRARAFWNYQCGFFFRI